MTGALGACRRPSAEGEPGALVTSPTRALPARLARADADRYRPYDQARGAARFDPPPLGALAQLERKGDLHGVAAAWLLAGDARQAAPWLERAPRSPDVDSDRGVVALVRGDGAAAIALFDDVLRAQPRHPEARWNRALALESLGLGAAAAAEFEAVKTFAEPGWSDEATARAAAIAAPLAARRRSWEAARDAGLKMVKSSTPSPIAFVVAHPGVTRHLLYHAMRAATSRERLLGLREVAQALDRLAGGTVLVDALVRAAAGFPAREPLAATYGRLYANEPIGEREREAWLAALRRTGQLDILAGAILLRGAAPEHAGELAAYARASGDTWMVALVAHEAARAEIARGELLRAEARLTAALSECRGIAMEYRCGYLSHELAQLEKVMHRPVDARRVALAGWERARRAGEWGTEALFLQDLAGAAEFHNDFSLSRAYLEETMRRDFGACSVERYVRHQLAMIAIDERRPDEARREASRTPLCGEPLSLAGAYVLATLAHWGCAPDEATGAREALVALRARGGLSPAQHALADEVEGRLTIECDPGSGGRYFARAIERAERLPAWDAEAVKARSFSYAGLVDLAGRSGDFGGALTVMARELGEAAPARCAVGASLDYDELTVAVRGASGEALGRHEAHHAGAVVAASLIDATMRSALDACHSVDLFARPPLQGDPSILPPEIAWRYRVSRRSRLALPAPLPPRRLVVSDVTPPPSLELPPLAPSPPLLPAPAGETWLHLAGAAATPARVLAEMATATEIELHVHGLVDLGLSDASLLALSPDADGRYALTAGEVRRTGLRGEPLVILAACRAAETAPYEHQPWSLPMAFVEAGARVVLASPRPLRDLEAAPFFDEVRARLRRGQSAAAALRDARMAWIKRDPASSVRDILLFE